MRVILYTGKGGVGKTTVSAATAVRCAQLGLRTLVISTDAAHSLGDSLDRQLGDKPVKVAENLWAQEINALHELEHHWENIHKYLRTLFASQGIDEIVAEELASPPGMEEVASLMVIRAHRNSGAFDVIIVDCAPTGETLQLLAFPDVAKWYLEHIFPIERNLMKVARPVMQRFVAMPLPSDEMFGYVKDLLLDLESMKKILGDRTTSSVRIVLNLEKMVVKEAQRAFTYLSLYDYLTDCVIVNRRLPEEASDPYFAAWRRSQARYSDIVEEAFSPVPILETRLFDHEIVGLKNLSEMGHSLYGDRDPSAIFYKHISQRLKKRGETFELELELPFVSQKEIELNHEEGELFITIGPYKREISLPRALNGATVDKATLNEGVLKVTFSRKAS